jgi:predicted hotdog family 3-hydroxylacyl-ACP dehydratase
MSFETINAADLVPQKPPFVFVDKLTYADENRSCTVFNIPEVNIFVKNGFYSAPGLIESMAQTAAAGTGYLFRKNDKGIPVGYIGAIQKLSVFDLPPAKAEINMEVNLLTNLLQVSLVSGVVRYGGKIMVSCEMKIFINPHV